MNLIPEWLSPELVLGIIGTVTGVLSLVIHYVRLQREKPNIKPEVTECEHYLERRKDGQPTFHLILDLRIKNKGNQGTTLNKIEASFYDKQKRHLVESDLFQALDTVILRPALPVENLWIGPHKTINTRCRFISEGEVIKQRVLECSFILHHTHGKVQFGVTSPVPSSE